jgi:hypothetical protein
MNWTFFGRGSRRAVTQNQPMTKLLMPAFASLCLAAYSHTAGPVQPKSLSKLAFSPDGVLFVADSIDSRVYAIDLEDRTPQALPKELNIADLEGKIGALIGVDSRDVMIHDMAVNPVSQNIYLTVSRGRRAMIQAWQLPNDVANPAVLLRISPASGAITEVSLKNVKHSYVEITNPPDPNAKTPWKDAKQRVDTVSDLAFHDGKLYLAGLSNQEFSSVMRVISYPFSGAATPSSTTFEVYHGAHGQYETDSPVRAFLPIRVGNKPVLLASYLCSPLAIFPMDALKDKAQVKGQTIAEMGSGNYPLDMVAFKFKGEDHIIVVNNNRGVLLIKSSDLEKPLPNITSRVEDTAGIPFRPLRNRGVIRADNLGSKNLALLARNVLSGEVRLFNMPLE